MAASAAASSSSASTGSKVFWIGRHATRPELGAPVSKVHGAGLRLLRSLGWVQVANDTPEVPVFALTTRRGANYPADQPGLPTVRQLPHANTACLDDKRQLLLHLRAAGAAHLLPQSWADLGELAQWLDVQQQQQDQQQQDGVHPPKEQQDQQQQQQQQQEQEEDPPLPCTLFIKHRLGVKGQAVHVVRTVQQLRQLARRLAPGSAADFTVQREVAPPMLLQDRKFVLRLHVLAVVSREARGAAEPAAAPAAAAAGPSPAAAALDAAGLGVWAHRDVIVLRHAAAYDPRSPDAAAHVSSRGRGHPAPLLLADLPPALAAAAWPQLTALAASALAASAEMFMAPAVHPADPAAVLYALLGFDCVLDATGRALLLEVNAYPAVASGTMAAVPVVVFDRLLRDLVTLLVLPVADGAAPRPGGFLRCA